MKLFIVILILSLTTSLHAQTLTVNTVALAKITIVAPTRLDVAFSGADGSPRNFIGVFPPGAANSGYVASLYLDGTATSIRKSGSSISSLASGTVSFLGVKPGAYEVRLCNPAVSPMVCSPSVPVTIDTSNVPMQIGLQPGATIVQKLLVPSGSQYTITYGKTAVVTTDSNIQTTITGP